MHRIVFSNEKNYTHWNVEDMQAIEAMIAEEAEKIAAQVLEGSESVSLVYAKKGPGRHRYGRYSGDVRRGGTHILVPKPSESPLEAVALLPVSEDAVEEFAKWLLSEMRPGMTSDYNTSIPGWDAAARAKHQERDKVASQAKLALVRKAVDMGIRRNKKPGARLLHPKNSKETVIQNQINAYEKESRAARTIHWVGVRDAYNDYSRAREQLEIQRERLAKKGVEVKPYPSFSDWLREKADEYEGS